ncbi:hypothetical protein WJT74_06860 [Sphingomicrobium sp. XHP0239]|uniref:hypothetical protein n=1 Tax=Sphingomicrobium maritimum TaxID=3133972 RepID=UPI0031CC82B5
MQPLLPQTVFVNDQSPPLTQRTAKRARRLAELEDVLTDCARLLDAIAPGCPEARLIEQRIERAQREIDRLRSHGNVAPARADQQRDLLDQLSYWSGNVLDLYPAASSKR